MNPLMLSRTVALVAVTAAIQIPTTALAASAFAAGIPTSVAEGGVAVGTGYNYSSRSTAESRAISECQSPGAAPQSTRNLCTIIAYFDNECLSVSFDPQAGTPGFGWAVGATSSIAQNQALANCKATAGSRAAYCEVRITDCDTHN